jgi:hypothetical protein
MMKKAILLVTLFVAILIISNPSTERHRLAACAEFQEKVVSQKREDKFLPSQVWDIVVNKSNLTVKNYCLFSCSYYPFLPEGYNSDIERIECLGVVGILFDMSEITHKRTIE